MGRQAASVMMVFEEWFVAMQEPGRHLHGTRKMSVKSPSTQLLMSETEDIEAVSRNPDSLTENELLDLYLSSNEHGPSEAKSYGVRGWGLDDMIEAEFYDVPRACSLNVPRVGVRGRRMAR
ncbi:MAG: hypothetical protein R3B67_02505 [Phycisphaerales bacterium]